MFIILLMDCRLEFVKQHVWIVSTLNKILTDTSDDLTVI